MGRFNYYDLREKDPHQIRLKDVLNKRYKRIDLAIKKANGDKQRLEIIAAHFGLTADYVSSRLKNMELFQEFDKRWAFEEANPIFLSNWTAIKRGNYEYVYAIQCDATRKLVYIGKAKDPRARIQHHFCLAVERRSPIQKWAESNKLLKRRAIILERTTAKKIFQKEKKWIKHYLSRGHPLLNKSCTK